MFLEVTNLSDLIKIIAEQAPNALHWLIGILGSVSGVTIIGAIWAIVKSLLANKHLDKTIETSAKESKEYADKKNEELKAEILESNKDSALIAEILLMLASKSGFTPEEIVSVTKRVGSFANADKALSEEIIEQVNKQAETNENEAKIKAEEEAKVNKEISSLKSTNEESEAKVEIKL